MDRNDAMCKRAQQLSALLSLPIASVFLLFASVFISALNMTEQMKCAQHPVTKWIPGHHWHARIFVPAWRTQLVLRCIDKAMRDFHNDEE